MNQKGSCWSGPLLGPWSARPQEPKHCLSSHTQPPSVGHRAAIEGPWGPGGGTGPCYRQRLSHAPRSLSPRDKPVLVLGAVLTQQPGSQQLRDPLRIRDSALQRRRQRKPKPSVRAESWGAEGHPGRLLGEPSPLHLTRCPAPLAGAWPGHSPALASRLQEAWKDYASPLSPRVPSPVLKPTHVCRSISERQFAAPRHPRSQHACIEHLLYTHALGWVHT